jgi:hypothetical protein
MGRGGWNQKGVDSGKVSPLNPAWDGGCSDCSGFISYDLRMSRYQADKNKAWSDYFHWIETTEIYHNAINDKNPFVRIDRPVPGCFVVYPDKGKKQGHIEVIEKAWLGKKGFEYDTIGCSAGFQGSALMKRAIRRRKNAHRLFEKAGAIYVCLKQDLA